MKIICIEGPDSGSKFRLNEGVIRIGRAAENDIMLTDRLTSREHLLLRVEDGDVFVINKRPTNPVLVNNSITSDKTVLKSGDRINLGNTVFAAYGDDEDVPAFKAKQIQEPAPEEVNNSVANLADEVTVYLKGTLPQIS